MKHTTVTSIDVQRVHERVSGQFNEKERVDLTLAIVTINGWNRLAKSFRTVPGIYAPRPVSKG